MEKGTELKGKLGHINKSIEEELDWLEEQLNRDELPTSDSDYLNYIKSALIELKSIKEANPSEAFGLIKRTCELYIDSMKQRDLIGYDIIEKQINEGLDTIKQYILKAQEQKEMIIELCEYYGLDNLYPYDELEKIEMALKNARDMSSQQRIELLGKLNKQEKVLNIIKEKNVDIDMIKNYQTVIEYNWNIRFEKYKRKELTEEEFKLLKRYFDER